MGLSGQDVEEWSNYRMQIQSAGLSFYNEGDKLVWVGKMKNDALVVKNKYSNINLFDIMDYTSTGFEKF